MPTWDTIGKIRMTPKGVYDPTVTYEVLDLVSNDIKNKYYIAKQDVPVGTVLTNTTYWINILDVSDAYITIGDSIATLAEFKTYLGIT